MTIDLESFTGPQASQATADRARTLLLDSGVRGTQETWVVDEIPGTGSTLRVAMDGTGMYSVAAGVGFLDAGATSVLFDAATTAVTARASEDLVTIGEAAHDLTHGIVSLSTDDSRARYFGGDYLTPRRYLPSRCSPRPPRATRSPRSRTKPVPRSRQPLRATMPPRS
ncbi:hypothetical protein NKG05_17315 [Oerskovia sp. M15]